MTSDAQLRYGRSPTVLIYESDTSVLSYLRFLLEDCGFRVQAAVSQKADVESEISKHHSEIIVFSHPQADAICALLDEIRIPGDLRVVVCTVITATATKDRLKAAGVTDLIPRTVSDIGGLVSVLHRDCWSSEKGFRSSFRAY
jgi:CheY-like chemotaxis protein